MCNKSLSIQYHDNGDHQQMNQFLQTKVVYLKMSMFYETIK